MAIDLKDDIKQFFNKWKAVKGSGVPQIQNLLEIDRTKPHPFRRYPAGYVKNGIDLSNRPLQGCPRIFFIVADGQGELLTDPNGELYVAGATDSEGMARARFEMPLYKYDNAGQNKKDDDWVDGFRGLMARFGVTVAPQTLAEKEEEKIPAPFRFEAIEEAVKTEPEETVERMIQTHDLYAALHRLTQKKEDDDGYFAL
jgi:hypothetical protein